MAKHPGCLAKFRPTPKNALGFWPKMARHPNKPWAFGHTWPGAQNKPWAFGPNRPGTQNHLGLGPKTIRRPKTTLVFWPNMARHPQKNPGFRPELAQQPKKKRAFGPNGPAPSPGGGFLSSEFFFRTGGLRDPGRGKDTPEGRQNSEVRIPPLGGGGLGDQDPGPLCGHDVATVWPRLGHYLATK